MLWIGQKEVSQLWVGSKPVKALYQGAKLIWEAVNSCFGNGFWVKDKAWSKTDLWRK